MKFQFFKIINEKLTGGRKQDLLKLINNNKYTHKISIDTF